MHWMMYEINWLLGWFFFKPSGVIDGFWYEDVREGGREGRSEGRIHFFLIFQLALKVACIYINIIYIIQIPQINHKWLVTGYCSFVFCQNASGLDLDKNTRQLYLNLPSFFPLLLFC